MRPMYGKPPSDLMGSGLDMNASYLPRAAAERIAGEAFAPLRSFPYTPPHPTIKYCKVGILPYFRDKDGLHLLLASPKPTKTVDEGEIFPFQMARGTPRAIDPKTGLYDLREEGEWKRAVELGHLIEHPARTALSEAQDELGLKPENITRWIECGVVKYKTYGIDLHLVEVKNPDLIPNRANDSNVVAWHTLPEIQKKAKACPDPTPRLDQFKKGYLPIIMAASELLEKIPDIIPPSRRGL